MKTKLYPAAAAIAIPLVTGCSGVNFFDTNDSTTEPSGFLYYPPKPYILIEQGEKAITTRLISIPDLSRPHRVKQRAGFGTSELGFDVENGMIVKFNSKNDSKASEGLTALAGLGTAKAAILTAEAAKATAAQELQPSVSAAALVSGNQRYDVVILVEAIAAIRDEVVGELGKAANNGARYQTEIETLNKQVDELASMGTIEYPVNNPDKLIAGIEEYRKRTVKVINELSSVKTVLNIYAENPKLYPDDFKFALDARDKLTEVITSLRGFSSRSSSIVGLYEIQFIDGKLQLRKVSLE